MVDKLKQKKIEEVLEKYKDSINGIDDLTAGKDPSLLFYFLIDAFGYLLENDVEKTISQRGILNRRKFNFLIKKFGPNFLGNPQVIENRNFLKDQYAIDPSQVKEDSGIILPDKPVIWTANHAFKDDTLASIIAIYRHAYILFGSLPQFYNTIDGIMAWVVGVSMVNRKNRDSKHSSVEKAVKAIELGADLFEFPEGVLNKTPNQLLIDLWPGIYRISKETGALVVPMAHYIRECSKTKIPNNQIHTVIDDPIRIDDLSEKAGLQYLRDAIATNYYLMMEKYGKSTYEEELKGFNDSSEAWEAHLKERVATAAYYDEEIELSADYRPKDKIRPEDVWQVIADLHPNDEYNEIKTLIKTEKRRDFQRRF